MSPLLQLGRTWLWTPRWASSAGRLTSLTTHVMTMRSGSAVKVIIMTDGFNLAESLKSSIFKIIYTFWICRTLWILHQHNRWKMRHCVRCWWQTELPISKLVYLSKVFLQLPMTKQEQLAIDKMCFYCRLPSCVAAKAGLCLNQWTMLKIKQWGIWFLTTTLTGSVLRTSLSTHSELFFTVKKKMKENPGFQLTSNQVHKFAHTTFYTFPNSRANYAPDVQ